ncbi:MAG: FCD domain-containing protein, partial [Burkholderiaceae bacterium]
LIASGAQVGKMRNDKVVDEHTALVDALERHDCKAAHRVITEHVERSIDAFAMARVQLAEQPRLGRLS